MESSEEPERQPGYWAWTDDSEAAFMEGATTSEDAAERFARDIHGAYGRVIYVALEVQEHPIGFVRADP